MSADRFEFRGIAIGCRPRDGLRPGPPSAPCCRAQCRAPAALWRAKPTGLVRAISRA